jgi:hypothetical protein
MMKALKPNTPTIEIATRLTVDKAVVGCPGKKIAN